MTLRFRLRPCVLIAFIALAAACPREPGPNTAVALATDASLASLPPPDAAAPARARTPPAPEPARDGRAFETDATATYTVVATVADAAMLQGSVRFVGARPPLPPAWKLTKDAPTDPCASTRASRLALDAEGHVGNAVVSLVGVRRGLALDVQKPVALAVQGCAFVPRVVVAPLGGQLVLKNQDEVLHNAHAYLGAKTLFNVGLSRPGVEIPRRLVRAGLLEVGCNAGHPTEAAWVVVATHPYHAVTDAQGRFALRGIPPGDYHVRLWHPGWRVTTTHAEGRHTFEAPRTVEKSVTLIPNKALQLNFELNDD